MPRYSLRTLILFITAIGVAMLLLFFNNVAIDQPRGQPIYPVAYATTQLTWLLLFFSFLSMLLRKGQARAFWTGFFVGELAYLAMLQWAVHGQIAFAPDSLVNYTQEQKWLPDSDYGMAALGGWMQSLHAVAHSLLAWFSAFGCGLLGVWLSGRDAEPAEEK